MKTKTCVLCNKNFEEWGNNPAPLKSEGQCCDDCNHTKVIPERMKEIAMRICPDD